jgi:hypothetical protein
MTKSLNSRWRKSRERREWRGARLTRRVREEYRVYFDRNATMRAAERPGQAGCIAARTPRDFFHRLLAVADSCARHPEHGGTHLEGVPKGRRQLGRQPAAAPATAAGDDRTTAWSTHPGPETVLPLPPPPIGLKRPFHGFVLSKSLNLQEKPGGQHPCRDTALPSLTVYRQRTFHVKWVLVSPRGFPAVHGAVRVPPSVPQRSMRPVHHDGNGFSVG